MLSREYLQEQIRKTQFAMSNPCLTGSELRYLKARLSAAESALARHPHD